MSHARFASLPPLTSNSFCLHQCSSPSPFSLAMPMPLSCPCTPPMALFHSSLVAPSPLSSDILYLDGYIECLAFWLTIIDIISPFCSAPITRSPSSPTPPLVMTRITTSKVELKAGRRPRASIRRRDKSLANAKGWLGGDATTDKDRGAEPRRRE